MILQLIFDIWLQILKIVYKLEGTQQSTFLKINDDIAIAAIRPDHLALNPQHEGPAKSRPATRLRYDGVWVECAGTFIVYNFHINLLLLVHVQKIRFYK